MAGRMENKVVIVTGGGSGIGRATCYRLRQEGAKVVVADRNMAGAEETRDLMEGNDQNSAVSRVDISRSSQVEQMVSDTVSKFGRLDGLVNGAAILIRTPPLVEVDDVDWKSARFSKIIEIRAIWFQPTQLGASVDCREICVYPDNVSCGFDDIDDESDDE